MSPRGASSRAVRADVPLLRLDAAAIRAGMRAAMRQARASAIDLSGDGWGLGAELLASLAVRCGVGRVRIDARQFALLSSLGLEEAREGDRLVGAREVLGRDDAGLTLRGTVLSTKAIREGEGVSYGHIHHATRDGAIALVTGGYAQGVVRALGSRASVLLRGRRAPIVGRVAMDVSVVDVTEAAAEPGDEVLFLGGVGGPTLLEWEHVTGWDLEDLLAVLAARTRREVVDA